MIGGNVRQFRAGLLNFLLETARDYGPLASFRIGPKGVFLASGHNLIEKVLVTDAKYYIKHFGARVFKPVLGNGLVTSECVFWHRQRKLIQPALGARVMLMKGAQLELAAQKNLNLQGGLKLSGAHKKPRL
jgi:cytochrome P450